MSPTVEAQLLEMMRELQGDVSEIKGRVIAIEAAQSKREAICVLTHKAVDSRLDALESDQETTGIHEREQLDREIQRYRESQTHWHRYVIGVLGTLATGGVGWLVVHALTHR